MTYEQARRELQHALEMADLLENSYVESPIRTEAFRALLSEREVGREALKEITMQDVRLAVGEGPLKPADVLAGCNAELRRRLSLLGGE